MLDLAGFEPATWRLTVDVVLQAFAVTFKVFKETVATIFGETSALKLHFRLAGFEPASPA